MHPKLTKNKPLKSYHISFVYNKLKISFKKIFTVDWWG